MARASQRPELPLRSAPDGTKVRRVLKGILESRDFRAGEFSVHEIPAQPARYGDWPADLPSGLAATLRRRGIDRPYAHQEEAIRRIGAGESVVVVTPTASGKTLCYNVPILARLMADPQARALYLFPTKALANDQREELHALIVETGEAFKTFTFDGDTPADARRAIREQGHVVVTNPDMLHQGILPHHTRWARLFENLKYVVVDELHIYRGVFGSHLTNVLRRLLRLAAFHGSRPILIGCSATLANPKEHAEMIFERPVAMIDADGAPRAAKTLVLYNPPVINAELGLRKGALNQARRIVRRFIHEGIQTIAFTSSRQSVEVLTKYLKDLFEGRLKRPGLIRGYRGGYLPDLRREIEKGVREGLVLGVVSTNALELGIDIGRLEVGVLVGYPGTIASTLQQAGRAGRRGGHSAVFLIARSNPLDQFVVTHPEFLLGRAPERALIEPNNPLILMAHVQCAAFEKPFRDGEAFGRLSREDTRSVLEHLSHRDRPGGAVLNFARGYYHWMADAYPAGSVSLRSVAQDNFTVIDTGSGPPRVIAEVDFDGAHQTLYPGAIYLLESRQYHVDRLEYAERKAYVHEVDGDCYTEAIDYSRLSILEDFELGWRVAGTERCRQAAVEWGEVDLVHRVAGYKKIKFYTLENVGYGEVHLPDRFMHTTSFWLTPTPEFLERMDRPRSDLIDGLLAMGYALHHLAATLLLCDVRDVLHAVGDRSADWFAVSGARGRGIYRMASGNVPSLLPAEALESFKPTLFLYDNHPGGIGFSHQLYDRHGELLANALEAIRSCRCTDGCPSCVGPTRELGARSKATALKILDALVWDG